MSGMGSILNGRYQLDQYLSEGGFARVYLATDLSLRRRVAVKVFKREAVPPAQVAAFLARFEREAQAVAALDHPNILTIFDYGQVVDTPYLVMPYVDGGSLANKLQPGQPLDPHRALIYLRQAAAALDYAYQEHQIVHRDIKPQNMLLRARDDRLLLADFGIAKVLGAESTDQSRTGVIGTFAYMPPEQFQGRVSPATDIYALGCLAFQLLAGSPPFTGPTEQVMYGHLMAQVPSLAERSGGRVGGALQGVIERALAKRPEERFPSAGALVNALEAALAAPPQPHVAGGGEVTVPLASSPVPASSPTPPNATSPVLAPVVSPIGTQPVGNAGPQVARVGGSGWGRRGVVAALVVLVLIVIGTAGWMLARVGSSTPTATVGTPTMAAPVNTTRPPATTTSVATPTRAPTATITPAATAARTATSTRRAASTATSAGVGQIYVVQPGDTLDSIARQFGVTRQQIIDANRLANPDFLDVGQELIIPGR